MFNKEAVAFKLDGTMYRKSRLELDDEICDVYVNEDIEENPKGSYLYDITEATYCQANDTENSERIFCSFHPKNSSINFGTIIQEIYKDRGINIDNDTEDFIVPVYTSRLLVKWSEEKRCFITASDEEMEKFIPDEIKPLIDTCNRLNRFNWALLIGFLIAVVAYIFK